MSISNKPASTPPTSNEGDSLSPIDPQKTAAARGQFLAAVLNMSWQLAIVVLVPVIGGVQLDKALKSSPLYLFVGLALALLGSVIVMWRALQAANRLPVPKLTETQKRAVKKSYDDEDED